MSPVQPLITSIDWGIHTLTNRLSHARHGQQKQGLLDGSPVFFRHQNSFISLAHDDDWLMRFSSFINQPIKIAPRLGCTNAGHEAPLMYSIYQQCTPFNTYVTLGAELGCGAWRTLTDYVVIHCINRA